MSLEIRQEYSADLRLPAQDTTTHGGAPLSSSGRSLPGSIARERSRTKASILGHVLKLGLRVSLKRAVVFSMRFVRHPFLTARWIAFLGEFGERYRLGLPHDDLVRKSIPTFFLHGASSSGRLDLLLNHFDVASEVLSRRSLMALWREARWRWERSPVALRTIAFSCNWPTIAVPVTRVPSQSGFAARATNTRFVRSASSSYALATTPTALRSAACRGRRTKMRNGR